MGTLFQDVRYGFRMLLKSPAFTALGLDVRDHAAGLLRSGAPGHARGPDDRLAPWVIGAEPDALEGER